MLLSPAASLLFCSPGVAQGPQQVTLMFKACVSMAVWPPHLPFQVLTLSHSLLQFLPLKSDFYYPLPPSDWVGEREVTVIHWSGELADRGDLV